MLEIKEEFRVRLDKALADSDMKPADLARATGISEATISQYRSGYSKPKDKRLIQIANALHVDPAWLMGLDVPMERASNLEEDMYKLAEEKQILDLLSQMTDAEKQELLDYMKYLISKRKDT